MERQKFLVMTIQKKKGDCTQILSGAQALTKPPAYGLVLCFSELKSRLFIYFSDRSIDRFLKF